MAVARSEIRMDEETHTYYVGDDSEPWPSVTSIISATVPKTLEYWGQSVACRGLQACSVTALVSAKQYPNGFYKLLNDTQHTITHVLAQAQERGKRIHAVLEYYAKYGELLPYQEFPATYQAQIQNLGVWLQEHQPEFLSNEILTYSPRHRYAGTLDAHCKINGEEWIIDLKTGKKIYPETHFPQLIAYEAAEQELGNEGIQHLGVLHLPEDGPCRLVEVPPKWGWEDFEVLLNCYQRRQIHKRKKAAA